MGLFAWARFSGINLWGVRALGVWASGGWGGAGFTDPETRAEQSVRCHCLKPLTSDLSSKNPTKELRKEIMIGNLTNVGFSRSR